MAADLQFTRSKEIWTFYWHFIDYCARWL